MNPEEKDFKGFNNFLKPKNLSGWYIPRNDVSEELNPDDNTNGTNSEAKPNKNSVFGKMFGKKKKDDEFPDFHENC